MKGMIGTRGIKVGIRGIRVGMWGIRVGMWGIRVEMLGMRGIRENTFLWFQSWDFKHNYANSDTILSEL